jgi:hypothetical protein
MFVSDPAGEALRLVGAPEPVGAAPSWSRRDSPPLARAARRVAVAAAALALIAGTMYVGFTEGVSAATDRGIGVTHVPSGGAVSYVGVRVGERVLDDPGLGALLSRAHVTAVVDGAVAAASPGDVKALTGAGVDVANGGWGQHHGIQWELASTDVVKASKAIKAATGERVHYFVPVRSVDGFDLVSARLINEHVVRPTGVKMRSTPSRLHAGAVYVIDARGADLTQLSSALSRIQQGLADRHVTVEPLSALHR